MAAKKEQKETAKPKKLSKAKQEKAGADAKKTAPKEFVPEKEIAVEDPFEILRFVLMTEKAIQLIENQNKLVFIVDRRKDKTEIRRAAEEAFQSKVEAVNTMVDQLGRKKAFIKFKETGQAGEIAIRLGII